VIEVILKNGSKQYLLGERVAETGAYRLYICTDTESGRQLLLQVATDVSFNGELDRSTFVLRTLAQVADEYEAEHTKVSPGEKPLGYNQLFPEVVDSFVPADQGARRVNILSFRGVEAVTAMVPLSNLAQKDRLRVDLASSAWIMGRLLKLLQFAHEQGISVRMLGANNVLIDPVVHRAVVFDWSQSTMHQAEVPLADRKDDISQVARTVLGAVGASVRDGTYPYPVGDERLYIDFLWNLACRREGNALHAHGKFYRLTDSVFGRGFKPFKTLPL
jgi:hypothetical protein